MPIAIPWIFGAAQAAAPYITSALGLGTTAAVYANRKEIGSSVRNLFNKDTGALPAPPEGYSYEFNPVAHTQNSEFPVDALSVNTKPSGYFRLVKNNTGGLKKDSNAGQYTREELEKFKRQSQNGKLPNFNKKPDGPNWGAVKELAKKVGGPAAGLYALEEIVDRVYSTDAFANWREAARHRDYVNYQDALDAREENKRILNEYTRINNDGETHKQTLADLNDRRKYVDTVLSLIRNGYLSEDVVDMNQKLKFEKESNEIIPFKVDSTNNRIKQDQLQLDSLQNKCNINNKRMEDGIQLTWEAMTRASIPVVGQLMSGQRGDSSWEGRSVSSLADGLNVRSWMNFFNKGISLPRIVFDEAAANAVGATSAKGVRWADDYLRKISDQYENKVSKELVNTVVPMLTQTTGNTIVGKGIDKIEQKFGNR